MNPDPLRYHPNSNQLSRKGRSRPGERRAGPAGGRGTGEGIGAVTVVVGGLLCLTAGILAYGFFWRGRGSFDLFEAESASWRWVTGADLNCERDPLRFYAKSLEELIDNGPQYEGEFKFPVTLAEPRGLHCDGKLIEGITLKQADALTKVTIDFARLARSLKEQCEAKERYDLRIEGVHGKDGSATETPEFSSEFSLHLDSRSPRIEEVSLGGVSHLFLKGGGTYKWYCADEARTPTVGLNFEVTDLETGLLEARVRCADDDRALLIPLEGGTSSACTIEDFLNSLLGDPSFTATKSGNAQKVIIAASDKARNLAEFSFTIALDSGPDVAVPADQAPVRKERDGKASVTLVSKDPGLPDRQRLGSLVTLELLGRTPPGARKRIDGTGLETRNDPADPSRFRVEFPLKDFVAANNGATVSLTLVEDGYINTGDKVSRVVVRDYLVEGDLPIKPQDPGAEPKGFRCEVLGEDPGKPLRLLWLDYPDWDSGRRFCLETAVQPRELRLSVTKGDGDETPTSPPATAELRPLPLGTPIEGRAMESSSSPTFTFDIAERFPRPSERVQDFTLRLTTVWGQAAEFPLSIFYASYLPLPFAFRSPGGAPFAPGPIIVDGIRALEFPLKPATELVTDFVLKGKDQGAEGKRIPLEQPPDEPRRAILLLNDLPEGSYYIEYTARNKFEAATRYYRSLLVLGEKPRVVFPDCEELSSDAIKDCILKVRIVDPTGVYRLILEEGQKFQQVDLADTALLEAQNLQAVAPYTIFDGPADKPRTFHVYTDLTWTCHISPFALPQLKVTAMDGPGLSERSSVSEKRVGCRSPYPEIFPWKQRFDDFPWIHVPADGDKPEFYISAYEVSWGIVRQLGGMSYGFQQQEDQGSNEPATGANWTSGDKRWPTWPQAVLSLAHANGYCIPTRSQWLTLLGYLNRLEREERQAFWEAANTGLSGTGRFLRVQEERPEMTSLKTKDHQALGPLCDLRHFLGNASELVLDDSTSAGTPSYSTVGGSTGHGCQPREYEDCIKATKVFPGQMFDRTGFRLVVYPGRTSHGECQTNERFREALIDYAQKIAKQQQ